jgi:hypothetical protein
MNKSDKDEAIYVPCIWCGREINKDIVCKRRHRKDEQPDQCKDCRDVRKFVEPARFRRVSRKHPTLGKIECLAWNGEIDDNWNPIDENGDLYRPGERICGAKDCVDVNHVIAPEPLTVSNIDLILASIEVRSKHTKARTK